MISVKISLAFVITFVLAIIAYFVSSSGLNAGISDILASLFIVATTISLLIVSMIQTPSVATGSQVKQAYAVDEPSQGESPHVTSGDTTTLYVGNLAYKANEQLVQEHFEKVGAVKSVRLVKDKRTGRRKGFGFIEISNGNERAFIEKLNESEFMERNIIVRPANEKQH